MTNALTRGSVALAGALFALASPLRAQRVSITSQPDTLLRLVMTWLPPRAAEPRPPRHATPPDGVWWAAVTPGVVRIVPVPAATPTREVFVVPRGHGGTWIRVSATVKGRTYADSVYVVTTPAAPAATRIGDRIRAVDSMAVYTIHPQTRVRTSNILVGQTLQACVQFFAEGRTLIADSCGGVGVALPYALAMDAMKVFRPGRTFIITN